MNKLFQKTAPLPPVAEASPLHPFYPLGVEIKNYIANDRDVLGMLTIFLGGWAVIFAVTWAFVSWANPRIKTNDKLVLIWFVLTGTIHFFFEGYFAFNHARMGGAQDLFGQLWKEYAMSDSRYLTSDPFVLCMESVTAVCWGPLSYVTVYLIVKQHPLRFPLQAIVSLGQIYGLILYYATSMFDLYFKGLNYCRPEPYYFWFYFFFMNFIWMVIPGYLLYQSTDRTIEAFKAVDRLEKQTGGNGVAKSPKSNGQSKKHK